MQHVKAKNYIMKYGMILLILNGFCETATND